VDRAGGTVARPLTSVGSATQRPTALQGDTPRDRAQAAASRESAASGPFGVGLSLAANLAQAQPTAWGRVVAAAAAAAFTGDLQAAVAGGQVTQQAGQDLFSHLQQLLFGPPGQNPQQIQQQYQQLVQAYDQHQAQGQITGPAAAQLRQALQALGAALGAPSSPLLSGQAGGALSAAARDRLR
jgi:hypothetical protein